VDPLMYATITVAYIIIVSCLAYCHILPARAILFLARRQQIVDVESFCKRLCRLASKCELLAERASTGKWKIEVMIPGWRGHLDAEKVIVSGLRLGAIPRYELMSQLEPVSTSDEKLPCAIKIVNASGHINIEHLVAALNELAGRNFRRVRAAWSCDGGTVRLYESPFDSVELKVKRIILQTGDATNVSFK